MPNPLISSTPWRWKKRNTSESRCPAADRPQRRRPPVTRRTASPTSASAVAVGVGLAHDRLVQLHPLLRHADEHGGPVAAHPGDERLDRGVVEEAVRRAPEDAAVHLEEAAEGVEQRQVAEEHVVLADLGERQRAREALEHEVAVAEADPLGRARRPRRVHDRRQVARPAPRGAAPSSVSRSHLGRARATTSSSGQDPRSRRRAGRSRRRGRASSPGAARAQRGHRGLALGDDGDGGAGEAEDLRDVRLGRRGRDQDRDEPGRMTGEIARAPSRAGSQRRSRRAPRRPRAPRVRGRSRPRAAPPGATTRSCPRPARGSRTASSRRTPGRGGENRVAIVRSERSIRSRMRAHQASTAPSSSMRRSTSGRRTSSRRSQHRSRVDAAAARAARASRSTARLSPGVRPW